MTMQITTLRPGLLVSLKTSILGNVKYISRTVEQEHTTESGEARAVWETERVISDPAELEAGKKARTRAQTLIRGVCSLSAFGLLCPEDKAGDLEKAIAEARAVTDAFNETAKLSRISVYVITGRIQPDDVEAVKAINSEMRELIDDMARGVRNMDVKTIRDAADKARSMGAMLSDEGQERVKAAIELARKVARQISKAGDDAAIVVDQAALNKIMNARTAFLDLDAQGEIQAPEVAAPALDLGMGA